MPLTYCLLGLAICAVWFPKVHIAPGYSLPPWIALFVCAIITGLAFGDIGPSALLSLAALAALTWGSCRVTQTAWKIVLISLAALLALALSLHVLPGFYNVKLIASTRISPDAALFTQYLNFDKGAAGLLLLAAYAPRCTTRLEWRDTVSKTVVVMFATAIAVFSVGMMTDYIRPDWKLPAFVLGFFAVNLLFTCVAEEAFFRGLIQERLSLFFERETVSSGQPSTSKAHWAFWIPITVSVLLFAVAHSAGGVLIVLLSGIAGVGYAVAYAVTRRIESAVFTHFFINAVYFIAFTYPYLQQH